VRIARDGVDDVGFGRFLELAFRMEGAHKSVSNITLIALDLELSRLDELQIHALEVFICLNENLLLPGLVPAV